MQPIETVGRGLPAPSASVAPHTLLGVAERSNLIQVATDEWIVMREFAQYPKAVVRGIRDTAGEARYLLLTWHPVRHRQRMVGIFATRQEAERAVPWPSRSPQLPGLPRPGAPA